jgi:TonB family protein
MGFRVAPVEHNPRCMAKMCFVLGLVWLVLVPGAHGAQDVWPPVGVVRLGPGITPPRLISQVQPVYTEAGMRGRIQGAVLIEFVVEVDGTPGATRIVRSLDAESGMDAAAVASLRQWRFTPAVKDGVPIRVVATANIEFTLRGEPIPMAWPVAFPAWSSAPIDWVAAEVTTGAVVIALRLPPQWAKLPATLPTVALWSDGTSHRSVGVFQSQPAPPQFTLPLPAGRLLEFGQFMAKGFGPRAVVRAEGQITVANSPWLWLDLDLNDEAHAWSFATVSQGHLVQLMCTVATPRLLQTEAQRDEALRGAAADCAAIVSSARVTSK